MADSSTYELRAIGWVESPLTDLDSSPRQGDEGAPDAWLRFEPEVLEALNRLLDDNRELFIPETQQIVK